jgi:hypothetical protein
MEYTASIMFLTAIWAIVVPSFLVTQPTMTLPTTLIAEVRMMAIYMLLTNTGIRTVMRGSTTPHTIVGEDSAI